MTKLHIFQKVANVLVYLFFLSATVYSVVAPPPNDEVSHGSWTYITPSFWIAYVWTAIHFLLGGFVIYQWFEPAHDVALHVVGWHFVISVLLSTAWLALLKSGHSIIALVFVLLTASSVSFVFYRLKNLAASGNIYDKVFIHAPFSLWHGWIVFFAVVNVFQAFTGVSAEGPSVFLRILVLFGILFLTSTAIGYVEYKKEKGDLTGAFVIGLGLVAVFTNQTDAWIHWGALTAAIIVFVYPARLFIKGSSSAENAPLLG
ncbi:hypothetical protein BDF14DRAFT_1754297 [Spinellus fusiger]|nr:hypothetical protein BDF14DRAFT_1754297 [Spinellus fusiger]